MNLNDLLLPAVLVVLILFVSADAAPDEGRLVSKSEFFDGRSDWKDAGGVESWSLAGPDLALTLAGGSTMKVSFSSPQVFRLYWDPAGRDTGEPSYAVVRRELSPVTPSVSTAPGLLVAETAGLRLEFGREAFGLRVYRNGVLTASTSRPPAVSGRRVASYWTMDPADQFFGLGEKAGPLKKNGQSVKMWNTDAYAWGKATDPLYVSVPFMVSARADLSWGLFLDNPRQTFFNLGRDKTGEARVGVVDGPLDLWFFADAGLPGVLSSYTALTGRIPLPPAWALGYHQSKYSYMNQEEVLETARRFVREGLPARVIYLDIDYMDGYRSFTVDPKAFPDPRAMVDELHALGFQVIAIIDPGIKVEPGYPVYDSGLALGAFFTDDKGGLLTGKVWPGVCAFPDYRSPAVRQWWGSQYKVLTDLGIDGFWNDMNEPAVFGGPGGTLSLDAPHDRLHNVYGHLMVQATREGLEALRPGVRPFVLSRAGYAGTQRYAAHWTGDNVAHWDHLKLNLTQVLNLGLSGYALTGADVGGYKGTPEPELFVRWMQLGALMPYFRNHTEKGHDGHEPWQFGKEAEDLSRRALELRRGLEPYLYDLAVEASLTGAPLVRPLFWEFPEDKTAYGLDDEFLVGEALLAAPVLAKGAAVRPVWLPAGSAWYDWYTGKRWEGGQWIRPPVTLESLPLFAREGSVVPWAGSRGLEFRVFPGRGPVHRFYADDGVSTAYAAGAFHRSEVRSPVSGTAAPVWTTLTDGWSSAPSTAQAVYPDGTRLPLSRN